MGLSIQNKQVTKDEEISLKDVYQILYNLENLTQADRIGQGPQDQAHTHY
jgi:hypothetical protein